MVNEADCFVASLLAKSFVSKSLSPPRPLTPTIIKTLSYYLISLIFIKIGVLKKGKQKYYVVWAGVKPGIYESWKECEAQIRGFPGARYKAFPNMEQAAEAFQGNPDDYRGKDIRPDLSKEELARIGLPDTNSISVDAACSGNPGDMEYRGVETDTSMELFRVGPYPQGTVNIGEFLAIVHALAYLKNKNNRLPIYSDSRTAIKWVKSKKTNTKLEKTTLNQYIFELIDRAEKWLQNNEYPNHILKWQTKYWGEIPADFGRK